MLMRAGGWKLSSVIAALCMVMKLSGYGAEGDGDWPRWRGPNADGISKENTLNPAALAGGAKFVWKAKVGVGFSSVVVKGDLAYALGNTNDQDTVYCLRVKDGSEEWKFSYASKAEKQYPGPRASPTLDGNEVYTFSRHGVVLCLDAAKGTKKWEKNIAAEYKLPNIDWAFSSSPVIDGESLFLNAGKQGVALNKKDGSKIWVSGQAKGGYATIVPYVQDGKKSLAVFGYKAIFGVDPATGVEQWSMPWETKYDVNAADPVFSAGKMFLSSGYGRPCALLDLTGGKPVVAWTNNTIRSQFSGVVLFDGYLYGIDGGIGAQCPLVCVKWDSGEEKWRQKLGYGSLIVIGGNIVFLTENGDLHIIEAAPAAYKEISSAKGVMPKVCWGPPAYSRGKLYCRSSEGTVACIDVGK
ncbi:MAG: hypothetical protein C0404_02895 [Verrucomicrobia bacterium]|nr:hypothetical protein [Verrucomicrobiota bacterium]